MSAWAAKMDDLSYDNDILFIQAAGNIPENIIKFEFSYFLNLA